MLARPFALQRSDVILRWLTIYLPYLLTYTRVGWILLLNWVVDKGCAVSLIRKMVTIYLAECESTWGQQYLNN